MKAAVIAGLGALALAACDDASEVRVITPADSTSRCIGESRSPECVVETLLACVARIDGRLCEVALRGTANKLCGMVEDERQFGDSTVCEGDPLADCDWFGLACTNDRPADVFSYRVTRIRPAPVDEVVDTFPGMTRDRVAAVTEVDVDRWVCYDMESRNLPLARPGGDTADRLAALWRRIQTLAWEIGLSKERPSPFVWYKAGGDYCWKPYKYWAWQLDDDWVVVRWTQEFSPYCETSDGCPESHWPPYRKILDYPPLRNGSVIE